MLAYLAKVHAEVRREPGKIIARIFIELAVFLFFYWLLKVAVVGPDGVQMLLYCIGTIVGSMTSAIFRGNRE